MRVCAWCGESFNVYILSGFWNLRSGIGFKRAIVLASMNISSAALVPFAAGSRSK